MYGRRRYRKRRLYRRRKYGLKKTINRQITRRLAPQIEKKFFDTSTSGSVDNTGTIIRLSSIPQGDTDTTRDGDALWCRYLQVKLDLKAADTTNLIRVILFMWHQDDNFVSPSSLQLLQNTLDIKSYFNYDSLRQNKFKILYDKTMAMEAATEDQARFVKIYRKIFKKISYSGGTVNGKNNLYMFILSDSGAATHPSYAMTARVSYTDS